MTATTNAERAAWPVVRTDPKASSSRAATGRAASVGFQPEGRRRMGARDFLNGARVRSAKSSVERGGDEQETGK